MTFYVRTLSLVSLFALAACSSTVAPQSSAPILTANTALAPQVPALQTPAQNTAMGVATTEAAYFIDPAISARLSANDRSQAASAQFYALQFGRPGAPRAWVGDAGTKGSVNVGPYVRVNNVDCRDFTHVVTVGGAAYTRKGTACREGNGTWSVADASAAT
jgi:surface antigen